MLDAFVEECAVESDAAAEAGGCRAGPDGQAVAEFTLQGLMAAAEMDPKV
jgi:hypothetical protein